MGRLLRNFVEIKARPKAGDGAKPVEMHAEVSAVREILLEMIGRERDRMGRFIPPVANEGGAEAMREAYPARQKKRKVAPTAIGAAGLVGGALALRAGLKGMKGGPGQIAQRVGLGIKKRMAAAGVIDGRHPVRFR